MSSESDSSKLGRGIDASHRSRNFKIALTGAFSALSVVLGFTPLGYISLGGVLSLTIMHIPVILATVIGGLASGITAGFIFGLSSLVRSAMQGGTPFFLNPLVSILPRVLIPVITWLVYNGLCKIPRMSKVISGSIAAGFGTLTNTVFVIFFICLLFHDAYFGAMAQVISSLGYDVNSLSFLGGYFLMLGYVLLSNGIWEIIAAILITAAVLGTIYVAKNKKSKLSSIEILEDDSAQN